MKNLVRKLLNPLGYTVRRTRKDGLPLDFTEALAELVMSVQPFTMTTPERIKALADSVEYVDKAGIEGDFVECGVWKGGSGMVMAKTLQKLGEERPIHLFDAYDTPIPAPSEEDLDGEGSAPMGDAKETRRYWDYTTVEEVKANLLGTGYPEEHLFFTKGLVEDTIPDHAPEKIAILRIDTDTHDSTRHELDHLYPRLEPGGVLLVDDYGSHAGARKAVEDYFAELGEPVLLTRLDGSGVIGVRCG